MAGLAGVTLKKRLPKTEKEKKKKKKKSQARIEPRIEPEKQRGEKVAKRINRPNGVELSGALESYR